MKNFYYATMLGVIFAIGGSGFAADNKPVKMIPERIILMPGEKPSHEMAINWRADRKRGSYVQYIPAPDGPRFERKAIQTTATVSEAVETTGGETAYYYSVKLNDLEPSQKYAYRVGNREGWSEWNHFSTAAEGAEGFEFLYLGDPQADILSQWSRTIREAFKKAPNAALVLYSGDIINNANYDFQWKEWFEGSGFISRMIPTIAVPGNHEYYRPNMQTPKSLSRFWEPQFEYPRNGVKGLEDTNYFIDYQGVRFVAMNGNDKIDEQVEWLDKVLTESKAKWNILIFHQPVYGAAINRDNKPYREKLLPIIDKHNVDLVLTGHDHTYCRTHLLANDKVVTEQPGKGTVYAVSVSGPKMYDLTKTNLDLIGRIAEDTQLFQVVDVESETLKYKSYTTTGLLYDGFELSKDASGMKSMKVLEPEVDTRTRAGKK